MHLPEEAEEVDGALEAPAMGKIADLFKSDTYAGCVKCEAELESSSGLYGPTILWCPNTQCLRFGLLVGTGIAVQRKKS